MKLLALFAFCLLSTPLFGLDVHAQGSGSTGGGDAVVDESGQAYLVDLFNGNLAHLQSRAEVRRRYFATEPLSSFVVRSAFPSFSRPDSALSCAVSMIQKRKEDFRAFQSLLQVVPNLEIGFSEAYFEPNQLLMLSAIPGSTLSQRVPEDRQLPTAVFEYQTLILNQRLFERMNPAHQCGLMVHELMRLMNFYLRDFDTLTTDEIEAVVRNLFLNEPMEPWMERHLKRIRFAAEHTQTFAIDGMAERNAILNQPTSAPSWADLEAPLDQQILLRFERRRRNAQAKLALLEAKSMQKFQQQTPGFKASAPDVSYLRLSPFSTAIHGSEWRKNGGVVRGTMNVLTHEIRNSR